MLYFVFVRPMPGPSVTSMWTQMVIPQTARDFVPNHFVFLAEKEVNPNVIEVNNSNVSIHDVKLETSCVDRSAQINFNVPENHGILNDLSDSDETGRHNDYASVSDVNYAGQTVMDETTVSGVSSSGQTVMDKKTATRPNKQAKQTKSKLTKSKKTKPNIPKR